ncbi:MAG: aldehyde dehydrogenase family protein [Oceanococcus sp.]
MSNLQADQPLQSIPEDAMRISRVYQAQQQRAIALRQSSAAERMQLIRRLRDAVLERRDEIYQAMSTDFHKPEAEVDLGEIMVVVQEANDAIKHLKRWMKPQKVKATMALMGTQNHIRYEPKGVCLIVAPWNFPVNLLLGPLISCLAAGNTAMLKPSEMTPATSTLMEEIINSLFDEKDVAVFQGGADVSQSLLELKFDHCFFTGSPAVGKIVMAACAKHLCSVTLELGGKSPVFVDKSAKLADAAGSLAFGKCGNAGQACISPDYALVEASIRDALVAELSAVLDRRFGKGAEAQKQNADFARIVNVRHTQRIKALIDDALERGATLAYGGDVDVEARWVQPTILVDVPDDALIMQEEIFGPVFPIRTWQNVDEAINWVNAGEKPLALYVYSNDDAMIEKVIGQTSSGDAAINTCMVHFLNHNLPFGGANNSGIGKAHGYHGFKSFSHERSVVRDRYAMSQLTSPPYNALTMKIIKFVVRFFS